MIGGEYIHIYSQTHTFSQCLSYFLICWWQILCRGFYLSVAEFINPFVSLGFSVLIRRVFLWWQDCIGIYPWFLLVLLWFCVWISDSIGISFDVQYERGWGFYLLLFTLLESRPAVLKPFTPVPFSLLIWDATVTPYWFTTFSAQRWSNNCHYFPTSTCYFSIWTLESNCLAIFSSVLLEKSREIAPEKNEETEI